MLYKEEQARIIKKRNETILSLVKAGKTYREVSSIVGVAPSMVSKVCDSTNPVPDFHLVNSREDINLLKIANVGKLCKKLKGKKYQAHVAKIVEFTPELQGLNISLSRRFYHILHKITSVPKCPICGNSVSWNDDTWSYRKTCKARCNGRYNVQSGNLYAAAVDLANERKNFSVSKFLEQCKELDLEWLDFEKYKGVEFKSSRLAGGYSYHRYTFKHLKCGTIFKDDLYSKPVL